MYSNYDDGGFKVPNINLFCKALKISWIKRVLDTKGGAWKILFCSTTCSFGGSIIWLSTDKQPNFLDRLNPFWWDVYNAWQDIMVNCEPDIDPDPLTQPLFYNKRICTKHNTFFYHNWYYHGVHYINDLVNEDGSFLSYEEFNEVHSVDNSHFLQYMAIIKAIPSEWKRIIRENKHCLDDFELPYPLKMITNLAKPSKYAYSQALVSLATRPTLAMQKWEKSLALKEDDVDWPVTFHAPYLSTNETKPRFFQVKILHRILPTKVSSLSTK